MRARKNSEHKIRISRRKMLEPLKVANKVNTMAQKVVDRQKDIEEKLLEEESKSTLMGFREKMGNQKDQIGLVRKFIERQIDNEVQ